MAATTSCAVTPSSNFRAVSLWLRSTGGRHFVLTSAIIFCDGPQMHLARPTCRVAAAQQRLLEQGRAARPSDRPNDGAWRPTDILSLPISTWYHVIWKRHSTCRRGIVGVLIRMTTTTRGIARWRLGIASGSACSRTTTIERLRDGDSAIADGASGPLRSSLLPSSESHQFTTVVGANNASTTTFTLDAVPSSCTGVPSTAGPNVRSCGPIEPSPPPSPGLPPPPPATTCGHRRRL